MKLDKRRTTCLAASPAEGFSVDPQSGAMRNVALMTVGPTISLRFYIDAITIQTAAAAIAKRGGKLRIYPTHTHAGYPHDWTERDCDDAGSELNYAAFCAEVKAAKTQLIGGRVEFYDAFRSGYAQQFQQIVECAAKTPELIGLSLEPIYHLVYVGKDGVEYNAWPEKVELAYDGLPVMRVDDIFTAAFGSVVDANENLFAQLSAKFGGKHLKRLARLIAAEFRGVELPPPTSAALAAKLGMQAPASDSRAPIEKLEQTNAPSPLMKIIADLQAKFGSDERKLGQAMLIVGKTPADKQSSLTIETIEATIMQADLTASTGQVTRLTTDLAAANTEITNLKTQVANLTSERDTLKTQLENAKKSGLPGTIDLGATSTGGGAPQENPFMTNNLTAQAKLTKTDPARAETFKQAAIAAKAAQAK